MSELRDDDLAERLLDSRVAFRSRFDEDDRETGGTVWQATFEGHLIVVITEDASAHATLIIDGEPRGELVGWPPKWRRA